MNGRKVISPRIAGGRIVVDETFEPDGAEQSPVRQRCPFHGMIGHERLGLVIGNPGSNGCALTLQHAPCQMEIDGETPHWDGCCRFNAPEQRPLLDRVVGGFTFLESMSSGEQLSGDEWFALKMKRPWQPPE